VTAPTSDAGAHKTKSSDPPASLTVPRRPFRPARPKCRPVLVLSHARERQARTALHPSGSPPATSANPRRTHAPHGDLSIATSRPFHSCWFAHANGILATVLPHTLTCSRQNTPRCVAVPRTFRCLFFPPSFSWLRFGVNPTARRASLPYFLRDPQKTISTAHSSKPTRSKFFFGPSTKRSNPSAWEVAPTQPLVAQEITGRKEKTKPCT
jgi:hypothetical protein